MTLHAQLSRRVLTRRAPQLNLLRNATSLFAASVGGAQSAASVPWDEMLGPPSEQSRRIARNTAFVLLEEGALARVADPGGGSYFVERLTSQFAQRAWETFQEIESKGGMFAVLQSGWCAEQVAAVAARRAADAARRKPGITGVSEFALLDEDLAACDPVDRTSLARLAVERVAARRADETVPSGFGEFGQRWEATVRAAEQGATLGLLALRLGMHQGETSVPSFPLRRLAEPFEALRDWSDASTVARGRRPCVYLANFGAPAEFLARATFARNFFAAGGCSAIEGSGATSGVDAANAYDASAAPVAVLCGTDAHYELFARDASRLLKERGASQVVLAGRPGDQEASFRAAGIDHFIYLGCNVLETLELLLGPEGAFAT